MTQHCPIDNSSDSATDFHIIKDKQDKDNNKS